jgi:hypothetical protein
MIVALGPRAGESRSPRGVAIAIARRLGALAPLPSIPKVPIPGAPCSMVKPYNNDGASFSALLQASAPGIRELSIALELSTGRD